MKDSTFIIGDRQFQESKVHKLISRKMGNVSKSSQCGNYEILLLRFFRQIFVTSIEFGRKLLCELISRNMVQMREKFLFFYNVQFCLAHSGNFTFQQISVKSIFSEINCTEQ